MSKIAIFASAATFTLAFVAALGFATLSSRSVDAADACQHKELKTVIAKEACTKGGQAAAKDAMKKFMKEAKIKSCNQCHAKLAPTYELKKDAFDQFVKAGGKLLDDKAAGGAGSGAGSGSAKPPATKTPAPKAPATK